MACLVKISEEDIFIAPNFVHAPGYSLIVSEMNASSPMVDGWKYHEANYTRDDFPPSWTQPAGAHDAYGLNDQVFHKGKIYQSIILGNVWEPTVSGWKEVVDVGEAPAWIQPTGAHDSYQMNAEVIHNGKRWQSKADANVWEPGVYGWQEVVTALPDQSPVIPEWVQPTGAQDAYAIGAIVKHNGFTWQSIVDANVWEPGVYGWNQV